MATSVKAEDKLALEIRSKSVEQALVPLVNQVRCFSLNALFSVVLH